jgi:hypothetical protein
MFVLSLALPRGLRRRSKIKGLRLTTPLSGGFHLFSVSTKPTTPGEPSGRALPDRVVY